MDSTMVYKQKRVQSFQRMPSNSVQQESKEQRFVGGEVAILMMWDNSKMNVYVHPFLCTWRIIQSLRFCFELAYIVQARLQLTVILLPQLSSALDYRHLPLRPVFVVFKPGNGRSWWALRESSGPFVLGIKVGSAGHAGRVRMQLVQQLN